MSDFDVAVIGAGVAGLTAGLFAAKGGARTIVIDAMGVGGQVMTVDHIENMPGIVAPVSGYELGPLLQEQAAGARAEFQLGQVSAIVPDGDVFLLRRDEEIRARAVIVAAGSSKRRLGIPGEDRLEGKGVSHCASCDGPLFRNKPVCVVGGGDAALDEALVLADHASEILLVHRGPALSAQNYLVEKIKEKPNIRVLLNTQAKEILGETGVSAVRLSTGEDYAVEGVFIYVGLEPNTAFLGDLVARDEAGFIRVDLAMRTSRAGIFAAGDIRSESARLLAASAGDGATAARSALRYLAKL